MQEIQWLRSDPAATRGRSRGQVFLVQCSRANELLARLCADARGSMACGRPSIRIARGQLPPREVDVFEAMRPCFQQP
jgi:hypothetical protein